MVETRRDNILGDIKYWIVDEDKAILDIKIVITKAQFEEKKKSNMGKSLIFIVIDKSGSMSGSTINAVKKAS